MVTENLAEKRMGRPRTAYLGREGKKEESYGLIEVGPDRPKGHVSEEMVKEAQSVLGRAVVKERVGQPDYELQMKQWDEA